MALSVTPTSDVSISISQVDYHGQTSVSSAGNAFTTFQADCFLAGSSGTTHKKTWTKDTEDQLVSISHIMADTVIVWSPCGQPTNLRVNTAITATKAKKTDPDARIVIEGSDTASQPGMHVFIKYRTCT